MLCWVLFMLLMFASADLKDCWACSPSYVFNSGGCSLWIVFDSDIPVVLDWPKTSCVGNNSFTASWALAISGSLFNDWNVSDTYTGDHFSSLGTTKLLYRHSFWISSNGVDWQEFNCPMHTKQLPFIVSANRLDKLMQSLQFQTSVWNAIQNMFLIYKYLFSSSSFWLILHHSTPYLKK